MVVISKAHNDPLTRLANRELLLQQLHHALLRAHRSNAMMAVLCFDVDDVSKVNARFGYEAGNNLLQVVAERLRSGVRATDSVSRLHGDEFAVVLESVSSEKNAEAILQRLTQRVNEPIDLLETELPVSVTVGMALYPRDADNPEELLHLATLQMRVEQKRAQQLRDCSS